MPWRSKCNMTLQPCERTGWWTEAKTLSPQALKSLDQNLNIKNDFLSLWWIVSELQAALEVKSIIPLIVMTTHKWIRPLHWLLVTQHPSLHCWMIFLSVLIQHCFALMLIFESVRSQMPSGFCNKWDLPTDCKEKLKSSSFLPFIPLFPSRKEKLWIEKKIYALLQMMLRTVWTWPWRIANLCFVSNVPASSQCQVQHRCIELPLKHRERSTDFTVLYSVPLTAYIHLSHGKKEQPRLKKTKK